MAQKCTALIGTTDVSNTYLFGTLMKISLTHSSKVSNASAEEMSMVLFVWRRSRKLKLNI